MRLEAAQGVVSAAAWRLPAECVALADALGRFLAETITSDLDLPPFDRSMLDGFACRAADLPGPMLQADYILAGECGAGPLPPGACARIMTGAPVPLGADYVFGIEYASESPEGVTFTGTRGKHGNIARRAEDVRQGDVLLHPGTRLLLQHLAVLATAGRAQVQVSRRPSVGILSTGTELVPVGATPTGAQIRNSNSVQLAALAQRAGAEIRDYGIIPDDRDAQREALRVGMEAHDVLLSTGGVSVGDRDYLPELIAELGCETHLRQVAIQPGKPIVFATRELRAVFALAGNPLSSYVQFLLLVQPFLCALQGGGAAPRVVRGVLGETLTRANAGRTLYRPVTMGNDGVVRPVAYHGSGHVTAYADADGLALMPEGVGELVVGEGVEVLLLR